jgi:hypothetical protein
VDALPAAEFYSGDDSAIRHSSAKRLLARHHACLVTGEPAQSLRYYVTHVDDYGHRYRQFSLYELPRPSSQT